MHFDHFVNGVRLSEAEGPAHIFNGTEVFRLKSLVSLPPVVEGGKLP